jgi:hypothetical protein
VLVAGTTLCWGVSPQLVVVTVVRKTVMLLLPTVVLVVRVVVRAQAHLVSLVRVVQEQRVRVMRAVLAVAVRAVVALVERLQLVLLALVAHRQLLEHLSPVRLVVSAMALAVVAVLVGRTLVLVGMVQTQTLGVALAARASLFFVTQTVRKTSPLSVLDLPTPRTLRAATRFTRLLLELVRLQSDYGSLRFP